MELCGYWRSSSTYRVRIALNLKGAAYTLRGVSLIKNGGEQNTPAYRAVNPEGKVPALILDDGETLTQSLAIIDYLEERWPEPALLPGDALERARIRAFALAIACDIQPLQNLAVLNVIRERFEGAPKAWAADWIARGLAALEETVARRGGPGPFLFGDGPSLAEVMLVPQLYNARRFEVDLSAFPRLLAADEAARALPAFAKAAPERQPDAPDAASA